MVYHEYCMLIGWATDNLFVIGQLGLVVYHKIVNSASLPARKYEEKTKKITTVSVVLCDFMAIYIHFSFDFLRLHNVNFKNFFANELINIDRF